MTGVDEQVMLGKLENIFEKIRSHVSMYHRDA